MSAAKADDTGRAARTAVKRKLVVHNFYGHRLSRFESFRHVDRLPKLSHVPSSQRSGAGMDEIRGVSFLCQWISAWHDQAKLPFSLFCEPILFQEYFGQLILQRCVFSLKQLVQLFRVLEFDLVTAHVFRHQGSIDEI